MNLNDAANQYHCNVTTMEKLFGKICRICWVVSVAGSPEISQLSVGDVDLKFEEK